MDNEQGTKRARRADAKTPRQCGEPSTPPSPDMAATVFEPVNAQIRPAECTSIRQQKAKLKLKEDMREERTAVESDREGDYDRVSDNGQAPQRRPSPRPIVSKPFQAGSGTYKIVYSESNGKQIPRFVPDTRSHSKDKKPTEANAKKDATQNKGYH